MQLYVNLAIETLRSEFPDFDIIMCFSIFKLDQQHFGRSSAKREERLQRLAQVFGVGLQELTDQFFDLRPMALHEYAKGCTSAQAWIVTIQRIETKQAAVRKHHPTSEIRSLVMRCLGRPVFVSGDLRRLVFYVCVCFHRCLTHQGFAAWNGLTSSGVEQNFAKLQRHVTPERDHMLLETELDEAILQLEQTLFTDLQLTQKAQQVWLKYFNPPRSRVEERIDVGCPKGQKSEANSEAAWKRKRDEKIIEGMRDKPDASLDEVQGLARDLSSHLLSDAILAEQAFQCGQAAHQ